MGTTEFSALWASFRGKGGTERDRVIVGVAAAFAHVAAANGVLEAAEVRRFLDVVRGSRLAGSDQTTSRQLSDAFETLVHTLLTRPELGRQECLQVLSDFGFDPTRKHKRRSSDYVIVAAAFVVCALLLLWAFLG